MQQKILVVHVNGKEREIDVSEIGKTVYMKYPIDMKGTGFRAVAIQVIAEGPILIIQVRQRENEAQSNLTSSPSSSSVSISISTSWA